MKQGCLRCNGPNARMFLKSVETASINDISSAYVERIYTSDTLQALVVTLISPKPSKDPV